MSHGRQLAQTLTLLGAERPCQLREAGIKPPASITVGPITYTISLSEADINREAAEQRLTTELWGNCNNRQQRILIRPGMAADHTAVTVLHEVLHACLEQAGRPCDDDEEDEERIVQPLAISLLDTLRRNPDLTTYLLGDGTP